MLTGDAKRAYQREYMRRKRAGEPTRKPQKPEKPEREPDWEAIDREVAHWIKYPRSCPAWADVVLDRRAEFDLRTEEGGQAFGRLYLKARADHRAKRKAEREEQAKREAEYEAERRIKRCSFCGTPQSEVRMLLGDDYRFICETCVEQASKIVAELRKTRAASERSGRGGRA